MALRRFSLKLYKEFSLVLYSSGDLGEVTDIYIPFKVLYIFLKANFDAGSIHRKTS